MRLRKAIKAALVGGVAAVLAGSLSAAPAQATTVTPFDAYWLQQKGVGTWPTYQADTNSQATNYCQTIGFNNPNYVGSCRIIDFWEESRTYVANHRENVSAYTALNCTSHDMSYAVGWSKTNKMSHSAGITVGLSVTLDFDVAPLGLGAGGSRTMSVAATYRFSYGTDSTMSATSTLNLKPYEKGWWEYGSYYGTAHGFFTVKIDYVRPGYGLTRPGTYKVLADFTGDLAKPVDPQALAAQPVTGLVAQTQPMSVAEKTAACT